MSNTRSVIFAALSVLIALTGPDVVVIVPTFCTGVRVTLADCIVTVCQNPLRSRTVNVCVSPLVAGNKPAFIVAIPFCELSLTASTPSTNCTSKPRARFTPAAVAGEFGSVYAWRPSVSTGKTSPTAAAPAAAAARGQGGQCGEHEQAPRRNRQARAIQVFMGPSPHVPIRVSVRHPREF